MSAGGHWIAVRRHTAAPVLTALTFCGGERDDNHLVMHEDCWSLTELRIVEQMPGQKVKEDRETEPEVRGFSLRRNCELKSES